MAATKQRKDWTTIDDEEGENFEARTEKERITRIREINENNTKKKVEEVVEIHKRIFPVRKAVKERKKMKKFGEVKGVPPGEHLPGDWILGDIVSIDTLEHMEKNEIDIVNRIKSITTDGVKERKAREKHEKLNREEEEVTQKPGDQPVVGKATGTDKLSKWIPTAGTEKTSIRITNIQPFYESDDKASEENFQVFLEKVFEENIMKNNKNMTKMPHFTLKMPRQNNGRLRGVAFMSFSDPDFTNKFYNCLESVRPVYNNCVLEISWATQDANRDKPRGERPDRGDRGNREDKSGFKPFRK